jgi:hypothetical protein
VGFRCLCFLFFYLISSVPTKRGISHQRQGQPKDVEEGIVVRSSSGLVAAIPGTGGICSRALSCSGIRLRKRDDCPLGLTFFLRGRLGGPSGKAVKRTLTPAPPSLQRAPTAMVQSGGLE